MSNKITNETQETVLKMFNDGLSQRAIAEKCGISPRSVGRIIDNANQDNEDIYAKPLEIAVKATPKVTNPNASLLHRF